MNEGMALRVKGLEAGYGDVPVLNGIELEVNENEMVAIIGPNGAGKSTFLRCVSGLVPIGGGEIWFHDKRISGLPCAHIVKMGVVHCMEGGKVLPEMTVEDNLLIGGYLQKRE